MYIDFAPPSKGTYNNTGSSRQLANYLEYEDLERMKKDTDFEDISKFSGPDRDIYNMV